MLFFVVLALMCFYNRSLKKHIILLSKCTSRLANKRIHIKLISSATSASYLTVICLWHNKLIVSSHLLIIISETSAVSLNFLIRTLNTMLSAVLFCLAWTMETRSCMAANPKTWIDFKLCKIRPLNSFSMLVNATVPLPCWTHYIGCPYGSASNINSACIFINVWMEQLRNISSILSHTNQKVLVSHAHQ